MKAALSALRYMLDNGADEKLLQEVTPGLGRRPAPPPPRRVLGSPTRRPSYHSNALAPKTPNVPLHQDAGSGRVACLSHFAHAAPSHVQITAAQRACDCRAAAVTPPPPPPPPPQGAQLAQSCLAFDFVGTLLDDSAEDVTTIQARAHAGASVAF
jgi:hypothetical protein